MIKNSIKLVIAVMMSIALTSCGFHLRQNLDFPTQLDTLYISSATPYGKFEEYLKNILNTTNINIVDNAKDSSYTLRIDMHQLTQTVSSISLDTQTRSYTLIYQVKYSLLHQGVTILPDQMISIAQAYITNSSQLSYANDSQMKTTITALQHSAAEQIIDRLSSQEVKDILNRRKSTK